MSYYQFPCYSDFVFGERNNDRLLAPFHHRLWRATLASHTLYCQMGIKQKVGIINKFQPFLFLTYKFV
jgi:hypothetical protein